MIFFVIDGLIQAIDAALSVCVEKEIVTIEIQSEDESLDDPNLVRYRGDQRCTNCKHHDAEYGLFQSFVKLDVGDMRRYLHVIQKNNLVSMERHQMSSVSSPVMISMPRS